MTAASRLKDQFTVPVVISLIALSVSVGSAIMSTRNAYSASRPYVTVVPQLDATGQREGIYLVNSGPGAAILSNITLKFHGKTYSGLGRDVWRTLQADAGISSDCFRTGWPRKNDALKSGEEDPLIALSGHASASCNAVLYRLLADDIRVRVEYRSMFDQAYTWKGSTHLFGLDPKSDSDFSE